MLQGGRSRPVLRIHNARMETLRHTSTKHQERGRLFGGKKMSVHDAIRARFVRSTRRRQGIERSWGRARGNEKQKERERERERKREQEGARRRHGNTEITFGHGVSPGCSYFAADRPGSPGPTLRSSSRHVPLLVKPSTRRCPSTSSRRRAPRRSESVRERERKGETIHGKKKGTRRREIPSIHQVRRGARARPLFETTATMIISLLNPPAS